MKQNLDLEIKVIKKIVTQEKQNRYIQFVSQIKTRHKFTNSLSHFKDFKWSLFEKINGNTRNEIINTLKKNKLDSKHCYIISENDEIDTKTLSITEAIHEVDGYRTGTILVFGDAEVIFYEGESIKESYLSKLLFD
jgi:hypothetical protein